jgi:anti-sigma factor ChrR (cupin superfamily)
MTSNLSSTLIEVAKLDWKPTKYPGISMKLLYRDEKTGMFTALFKWEPGAVLPYHEHVEVEQTYVIEGSFEDDDAVVTAGNYVHRPSGSRHSARSRDGAIILSMFLKPNIFFGQDGNAEEFSVAR